MNIDPITNFVNHLEEATQTAMDFGYDPSLTGKWIFFCKIVEPAKQGVQSPRVHKFEGTI
jgi:hypothetical protein